MKAENEGLYDATQQRSSNAGEGQDQMIGTLEIMDPVATFMAIG